MPSTEIVCFSQRASLNRNCVLRPTRFAQRKRCASPNATFNAITFSSDSYKRTSVFTVTIVWTVLHVCHCCHYMSLTEVYTRNCPCHEQRVSRLYMLGCNMPIFSHRVAQNSQTQQLQELLDIYTYSRQVSVPCRVTDVVILLHAHIPCLCGSVNSVL